MPGIRFDQVSKGFGEVTAVDRLSMEIEAGEFVSILGPSGCGKTTLLRMLAGLERPSAGTISIGETIINELAPAERNVAMVFQTYALYPHMTVAGNIEYPLKKRRIPKAERARRVREAATVLELEAAARAQAPGTFGGQQQRVALGRALVRDPAVFLLDEPLSNLDAKLRTHMRAELIRLHRRIGRTMVYVTHDQARGHDHVAAHRRAARRQAAAVRPPQDIYARPGNDFVAGFIGTPSMNFLTATWKAPARAACSGAATGRCRSGSCRSRRNTPSRIGGSGWAFAPSMSGSTAQGTAARVILVEPTGHETILVFDYLVQRNRRPHGRGSLTTARRQREPVFPGGKAATYSQLRTAGG